LKIPFLKYIPFYIKKINKNKTTLKTDLKRYLIKTYLNTTILTVKKTLKSILFYTLNNF